MTYHNRKAWYVDSVNYAAIAVWATGTAKSVGNFVRQVSPTVGNERVFICTTAGTTHATTEPTWALTGGAKQPLDNTVQWYECTGAAGVNGDMTNVMAANDALIRSLAQTVGIVVRNVANGAASLFILTTAGTPGAAEPTWNVTAGVTTADGSATWTSLGPQSNFTGWQAPCARLEIAYTLGAGSSGLGFGANTYTANSHSQTVAGILTLIANASGPFPANNICTNKSAAPPLDANITTGASIATTGNNVFNISPSAGFAALYNGFTFTCGSGANGPALTIGSQSCVMKNCTLVLGGTVTQILNGGSSRQRLIFDNTTVQFGAVGSNIAVTNSFLWKNTPSALAGAIFPTSGIFLNALTSGPQVLEGVDLSALANTSPIVGAMFNSGPVILKDCKLASGQLIATTPSSWGGGYIDLIRCDSGATNYRNERHHYTGDLTTETIVVRTGGGSDGTTSYSYKIVTTANSSWVCPFEGFPFADWNSTTGTNRNVTIEGIADPRFFAALPNNDDVWIDVEYLGSASSPMGSFQSGSKASPLATNAALTASTQAWDSLATARANTTAYAVGTIRKTATCPGMLFVVTSISGTGTTAGSEPAGFTGAVDGQAITDNPGANQVIWTAMWRFKQTVTLSSPQPQLKGPITVYPKMAKVSATLYLDPVIALS